METLGISDYCKIIPSVATGGVAGAWLGYLAVETAAKHFPNYLGRVIEECDAYAHGAIAGGALGITLSLISLRKVRDAGASEIAEMDADITDEPSLFMRLVPWAARYSVLVLKCIAVVGLVYVGGVLGGPMVAAGVAGAIFLSVVCRSAVCGFVRSFKSPEEQLKDVFASTSKKNRVISFQHEGKKYKIRCIHNPKRSPINIGGFCGTSRCIIAPEAGTPKKLTDKVCELIPKHARDEGQFIFGGTINGKVPYDLLASM